MTSDAAEYSQAIAGELRAERGRRKDTVESVVAATGLSKSAVLNYLNGKRDIPLSALARLCRALDVEPSVIAGRAEVQMAADRERRSA